MNTIDAIHMWLGSSDRLDSGSPRPEISLRILKYLACLELMVVGLAGITRDNGAVIDVV